MYFKVLDDNGAGMYSKMAWALPRQRKGGVYSPGKWMPEIPNLVACGSGYHLTDEAHLMEWLGPTIYVAEGRGESLESNNKTVFAQARLLRKLDTWNEKSARLFAADVAERVLPIWEAQFPNDRRPRNTITVARRFANGLATEGELRAAHDAARSAADAAYVAAYAANAAYAAAADDAAYTVDYMAAAAAANAAYVAAAATVTDCAAYAAANATVRTASIAANAAYAAAAGYAADAAARAAEREWQTAKLMEYLFPERNLNAL